MTQSDQIGVLTRMGIGAGGLFSLLLLTITFWLTPSPSGVGTHQQLGFPPCSAQLLTGMRCPACGMTTSWSYFVRGNWVKSLRANAGGFCLALVNVVVSPWLITSALWKRWVFSPPRGEWIGGTVLALVVVTGVDWGTRLATGF